MFEVLFSSIEVFLLLVFSLLQRLIFEIASCISLITSAVILRKRKSSFARWSGADSKPLSTVSTLLFLLLTTTFSIFSTPCSPNLTRVPIHSHFSGMFCISLRVSVVLVSCRGNASFAIALSATLYFLKAITHNIKSKKSEFLLLILLLL